MYSIGIIAEYNPFHTGHSYQIQELRRLAPSATIIIAMSGSMTQRGEPACLNKWLRAEAAILCGADIVVSLPTVYTLSSAQYFANAGVQLLHALGATGLSFGIEKGNIKDLETLAHRSHSSDFRKKLMAILKQGDSYSTAYRKTLEALQPSLSSLCQSPNNALAIAYLRACQQNNFAFHYYPIKRSSSHHSVEVQSFPSGSFLRTLLKQDRSWDHYIPQNCEALFRKARERGEYTDYTRYEDALLLIGRLKKDSLLHTISGFQEGIENRWRSALGAPHFTAVFNQVKTKRFTEPNLLRMMACLLLNIKKDWHITQLSKMPPYAQLLACSDNGRTYIKKQPFSIPLVQKWAPFYRTASKDIKDMLMIDNRAQDIHSYCSKNASFREGNQDFLRHPIAVNMI